MLFFYFYFLTDMAKKGKGRRRLESTDLDMFWLQVKEADTQLCILST